MPIIIWVLITLALSGLLYSVASAVYTFTTIYMQSEKFINNLKVGDVTNYGKVSELDGDYVVIKRDPLRIHTSEIQPSKFKANKYLFMYKDLQK